MTKIITTLFKDFVVHEISAPDGDTFGSPISNGYPIRLDADEQGGFVVPEGKTCYHPSPMVIDTPDVQILTRGGSKVTIGDTEVRKQRGDGGWNYVPVGALTITAIADEITEDAAYVCIRSRKDGVYIDRSVTVLQPRETFSADPVAGQNTHVAICDGSVSVQGLGTQIEPIKIVKIATAGNVLEAGETGAILVLMRTAK